VARLYSNRALTCSMTGDLPNALASAQEAVRLAPNFPRASMRLIVALRDVGDSVGAEAVAAAARTKFPKEAAFLKLLSELHLANRQGLGLSRALESMFGPYFAMQDASDQGLNPGEAKEVMEGAIRKLEAAAKADQEAGRIDLDRVSCSPGAEHWEVVRRRFEESAVDSAVSDEEVVLPPCPADEASLPPGIPPSDATATLDARIARANELLLVSRACLRAGKASLADKALLTAIRTLTLQGSVSPDDRKTAERAKLAVFAERGIVALHLREFDDADDFCERVLARVAKTNMNQSFVLRGGRKSDWDPMEEARTTVREALALAGQGRFKAALRGLSKVLPRRARDPWMHGLVNMLQGAKAQKDLERAKKQTELPEDSAGADDADADDSSESDGSDGEGALALEGSGEAALDERLLLKVDNSPQVGIPVLIITDTTFPLSQRVATEFLASTIIASGSASGAVPLKPRILDFRGWPFVDWSRETYVVFVIPPFRRPESFDKSLPGFMRWLAENQPSLPHIRYSVATAGNEKFFPGFSQAGVWLDTYFSKASVCVAPPASIDTSVGRSAIEETCVKWCGDVARGIQEDVTSLAPYPPSSVSFDYLSIRLQSGYPSLPVYRLAPTTALIRSCLVHGAGMLGEGVTLEAIAAASACRGGETVAITLELDPSAMLPASSLAVGDSLGVMVNNPPSLVRAFIDTLGVNPGMLVPSPPWVCSEPQVSVPARKGKWRPIVQSIAASCPALELLDIDAAASTPEEASFSPAPAPGRPNAHVSLLEALSAYYDLARCPAPLVACLIELRRAQGLPALPAELEGMATARDLTPLIKFANALSVPEILHMFDAKACKPAERPASGMVTQVLRTLSPVSANVAPLIRANSSMIKVSLDVPVSLVNQYEPGSHVKVYPNSGAFPTTPLEPTKDVVILAASHGVSLALAVALDRAHCGASGSVTVVYIPSLPLEVDVSTIPPHGWAEAPGLAELMRLAERHSTISVVLCPCPPPGKGWPSVCVPDSAVARALLHGMKTAPMPADIVSTVLESSLMYIAVPQAMGGGDSVLEALHMAQPSVASSQVTGLWLLKLKRGEVCEAVM
jgi:sulfite reductase alpha subunit-like flavoprotein/tetratricopeptide (TPR) repeat protein